MFAIVGLGNPGKQYSGTRHNVGFDTIDYLAERNNVNLTKMKYNAVYGETHIGGQKAILVKPLTYMNRSGESILQIYNYYKMPASNIIVIYDDIDIDLGVLRIRPKGSAGSHNGMKSVIYHLQDDKFPRIRIGIGRNEGNQDLADYVLGRFNKEEREIIDDTIERAAKAVEMIITDGANKAMNAYNG
ncbi:aminoacyl-tRNA hydrolase [Caldisalinibacter kiritimatiensis]|uniref:Peptidyl-tRNA hydrolase n=1 Tax=Caldisalinibacter kiritimatiensis TaxID=1304284 RepID=R1AT85_9FIRM|nr:aminoacyl-tRNA hydrolase [Caldisalinibacter kiritimatiensis]EOD00343.1 Peptidyl-tRNA hydrolase [Caldisalinibacter kiritimatiensis]